jgi:cytochrome b subunit of formate dehydrogenase
MGKRKYFTLSLFLVICALCSDFVSKGCFSKSACLSAKSVGVNISETDKAQAKGKSNEFSRKGTIFWYLGMSLAVLGLLSWIVSEFRNEPAWRLIPIGLFALYAFLQLMLV